MLDLFAKRAASYRNDILSGITVALALVPEAIAFAFVAGVPPHVGLYSAVIVGLITAVFGGRPGMISGATGAMAVVVVGLVAMHGIGYLFPAVILCGVFQVAVGLCRLGKLIRLVPHSVMLGFVNGLAIVIFTSQFGSFKTLDADGNLSAIGGAPLALMLVLVGLTMAIIVFAPFDQAGPQFAGGNFGGYRTELGNQPIRERSTARRRNGQCGPDCGRCVDVEPQEAAGGHGPG